MCKVSLVPFRRPRRQLKGKAYEKHSDTLIATIGPGTVAATALLVRDTEQGARDPEGGTDTIQLGRGNNEECNQGDICKFVNLTIQASPRIHNDDMGWIEWAFCLMKNVELPPSNVNSGIQTLGDICTKYLRNNCIYTGAVPVGKAQPVTQVIQLKIPKSRQRLVTGDEWFLFCRARTAEAVETATDTFRVILSFNYKNYH